MNRITIPVGETQTFAEVVAQFQAQGLAFSSVLHNGEFVITVTGC